jgi:hypothetical protein
MYQGPAKNFNSISDFMDRYYRSRTDKGRPNTEYRSALRNAARIAYKVAKKAVKAQQQEN